MEAFELLLEALGAHYRRHLGLCSEVCRIVLKVVLVFEQRDRYEQLRGRLMLVVESVVGRRMENGRSKGIAGPSVAESFAVTSFIAMSKFAGISVGATASQPPTASH